MQYQVLKTTFWFHTEQNTSSWHSLLLRIPIFEKATLTSKRFNIQTGCSVREGNEYKVYKKKKV